MILKILSLFWKQCTTSTTIDEDEYGNPVLPEPAIAMKSGRVAYSAIPTGEAAAHIGVFTTGQLLDWVPWATG